MRLCKSLLSCFLFLFVSESKVIRVLIVSDSMAKYVKDVRHTEVLAFPGTNINRLASKIQNGQISIDKEFSIFHVGTNDINMLNVGEIMSSFNNLISIVKKNSHTKIIMSSILPRPVDHQTTGDKVKLVNNKLKQLCKDRHVQYLHTFRPFVKNNQPVRELFAIKDQGLHLNLEGTRRLRQFFINTIAHLLKK